MRFSPNAKLCRAGKEKGPRNIVVKIISVRFLFLQSYGRKQKTMWSLKSQGSYGADERIRTASQALRASAGDAVPYRRQAGGAEFRSGARAAFPCLSPLKRWSAHCECCLIAYQQCALTRGGILPLYLLRSAVRIQVKTNKKYFPRWEVFFMELMSGFEPLTC